MIPKAPSNSRLLSGTQKPLELPVLEPESIPGNSVEYLNPGNLWFEHENTAWLSVYPESMFLVNFAFTLKFHSLNDDCLPTGVTVSRK